MVWCGDRGWVCRSGRAGFWSNQPKPTHTSSNTTTSQHYNTTNKNRDIRVKYVSERALLYALEIHTRPETLNEFVASAPMEPAKFVRDYARRILIRLKAESDDEGGDGEEE